MNVVAAHALACLLEGVADRQRATALDLPDRARASRVALDVRRADKMAHAAEHHVELARDEEREWDTACGAART